MKNPLVAFSIALVLSHATTVRAADEDDRDAVTLNAVDVTAKLDRSRSQLSPGIGASQYVIDEKGIEQLPLGDATPLNQMLLQAPGVVQDAFGQIHVRGDHADLQYRINGIILPESIGEFGQTLDPDIIARLQLLTGALPAQYGYRTAGIVEITTQTGKDDDDDAAEGDAVNGRVGVLAGSFGTLNPEVSLHASAERWSFFFTSDYLASDIGFENPTSARNAIHDHNNQTKGFGYVSYLLDEETRLTLMLGATDSRFEIPDRPDQPPNYMLAGVPAFDSARLDERQREVTRFGTAAVQGKIGGTDYQISAGQRYSSIDFRPDPIGDLIFDGIADTIDRSNRANTLQADFATPLGDAHTLRYGTYLSDEHPISDSTSLVFPAGIDGHQASSSPIVIVDEAPHLSARTVGIYAQDEWHAGDKLTVNYGLRADRVDASVREGQASPRVGLVYRATDATTLHAGYARYFTPPPAELISGNDVALFQGTTHQQGTGSNAPVRSERSHYFDVGVSQKVGDGLTLGLDAYYRRVRNLLDEGQFGTAPVFSPFNYERGRVRGLEFTGNYTSGELNAYLNVSANHAVGKDVISGQANFSPDELAYISAHWVHPDHDQRLSVSGGASHDWRGTRLGGDFLCGSGMRAGFANTAHLPSYCQLNVSANRDVALPEIGKATLRIAMLNVTDRVYELRDGSGIGVGAPRYGPRRGVFFAFSKAF